MSADAPDHHGHAFAFVGSPQRLPDHVSELANQPIQTLTGPVTGPPWSPFQSLPEVYG